MADLIIGLSQKAVEELVKKVEDAIKEEPELWQIVERDSVFIRDEFEMMKSFLNTADRDRVRNRNNVVRTWVRQVRDLAYDAEDCMDDVSDQDLEPKRPWWVSFWPRMVPTCCRCWPRGALDEAVDKIKLIKARVEEVSHRNQRYHLINSSGSQQAGTAMGMDLDLDLIKVQEGASKLMRWLLDYEGCQRRVISVWGTGGSSLGTISIIRNVFDDPKVCLMYKCRAWVKVMHPFSPKRFLGDLVAQLLTNSGTIVRGADVLSYMKNASSVDLAEKVEELVVKGGSVYFIVLEDLSNMVEWDTIRTYLPLPDEKNGSLVVVSTQHLEIARLCIGQQQYVQLELSQVSADHCVYALETRIPSQQGTDVASTSAAANYWRLLPHTSTEDEEKLRHQLSVNDSHVVTVSGPPNIGEHVVAKVCSQLLLGYGAESSSSSTPPTPSFELYGWVNVSKPIFNDVKGFAQSLLSVLRPNYSPSHSGHDPVGECSCLLREHRCLVVITGLQLTQQDCRALEGAGLIYYYYNNPPISCFVVVTSDQSVATYWTTKAAMIGPIAHVQQGQLPTPGSMNDITHLFHMANCWFPKYSSIIGRNHEVGALHRKISSYTYGARVVVIWGPPGVGKTALVEKVYSQFVINRLATHQRYALYGWVQVSNPFNLMGFSRSLLSILWPQSPQSPDPVRDCLNLLRNQTCLLVIDGLQSKENFWELANAGFIYANPYSCIVLIATEKSVTTLVPETDTFQVKPLDWWVSRELFKKVYRPESSIFSHEVMELVDKCCGLPILIRAVAKLVSADAAAQFTATLNDGKFMHELATNPHLAFVGLKGLLAWVGSDINAFPVSIRLLILYMLNFSGTRIIRRKRLVWRCIAEGYIKKTGICDMVTKAEEHVGELEKLTVIMMQVPPGVLTLRGGYRLSGFSSEVLMSRAAEDDLFFPLEVYTLTGGKHSLIRGPVGRHLRIDENWERDGIVFGNLDLSRLRSLTVYGRFEAFFINDSMRVLRVLDLEDAHVRSDDLKEIPKLLPRLRYLCVRGCIEINCLPDSIGDLRQLQTLDIRGTNITRLPDSILKLRNLHCLRAGYTMKAWSMGDPYVPDRTEGDSYIPEWRRWISSRLQGLASCFCWWQATQTSSSYARLPTQTSYASRGVGVIVPRGINQLTALHTLGIVNVNTAGGEAILEELGDLKQLCKLELDGISSYNVSGLRHLPDTLSNLSLGFTKDDATSSSIKVGLSGLPSSQGFRRLKLYGHVGILEVLPIGVTDLTLQIDDTSLTEDNMKNIGKLIGVVRTLRLDFHISQQGGGKLKFDANDGFPKLEVLEITSRNNRAPLHVEFAPGRGAVWTLKVLKLVGSPQMDGLHNLPSLEQVWIEGYSLRREIDWILEGHPNNPAVIDSHGWVLQFRADPANADNGIDEEPIVY